MTLALAWLAGSDEPEPDEAAAPAGLMGSDEPEPDR
jgi:hypothetical protein